MHSCACADVCRYQPVTTTATEPSTKTTTRHIGTTARGKLKLDDNATLKSCAVFFSGVNERHSLVFLLLSLLLLLLLFLLL